MQLISTIRDLYKTREGDAEVFQLARTTRRKSTVQMMTRKVGTRDHSMLFLKSYTNKAPILIESWTKSRTSSSKL